MNFKSRGNSQSVEPTLPRYRVDMEKLANEIVTEPDLTASSPLEYAPLAIRPQEPTVQQIKTFGELPTRELDAIVAAAEQEIAALKTEAQAIRDLYVKHTTRVANDIRRLMKGVELSMETMRSLRAQCEKLDDEPVKKEPSE